MRNKGLTLIEILLSTVILTTLLVGLLSLYIWCLSVQEASGNRTYVLNQMRTRLEVIRATDFDQILVDYPWGYEEDLTDLNGKIRVEAAFVVGSGGHLIDIRVIAGWVKRNGLIIGEGEVDGGGAFLFNDASPHGDGDGDIESPYELETAIARK